MVDKYPNPCTNCGLCCISELCPLAHSVLGEPKRRRCPALRFENGKSVCGLYADAPTDVKAEIGDVIGVGTGCDVSARVIFGGVTVQFESLSEKDKDVFVQKIIDGSITLLHS